MKSNTILLCMSAVILVAFIGVTACDNASPLADRTIDSESPAPIQNSSPTTLDSTDVTLATGVTNGTVDLDALDGQQDFMNFDASTGDLSSLSNVVNLNTPYEPPSSEPGQVNMRYQAYRNTPTNLYYDGSSQLYFQVDGTSYSDPLNGYKQDLMDWQQTFRDYANQAAGIAIPIENSVNSTRTSKSKRKDDFNLDAMNDQEIKRWLKEKGYKVKKLGNRRFELTRVVGGKQSSRKLYMHSVFDANRKEMTPLGITKNNKKLSKTLVKTKNGKRKSITRTNHSLFNKKAKKMYIKMISNQ